MSVPTNGECYSRLMEHIRMAEEESAMLAHLANANDHRAGAKQWLMVSELFRQMGIKVTSIAMGKLQ
jgi:hypothetical protein